MNHNITLLFAQFFLSFFRETVLSTFLSRRHRSRAAEGARKTWKRRVRDAVFEPSRLSALQQPLSQGGAAPLELPTAMIMNIEM